MSFWGFQVSFDHEVYRKFIVLLHRVVIKITMRHLLTRRTEFHSRGLKTSIVLLHMLWESLHLATVFVFCMFWCTMLCDALACNRARKRSMPCAYIHMMDVSTETVCQYPPLLCCTSLHTERSREAYMRAVARWMWDTVSCPPGTELKLFNFRHFKII